MPVARLHQPRGDVVERAGRAVDRPAQGDEHADHQVERLERLRRGCLPGLQRRWRRGGIDGRRAAALGKELEEAGLVLTEAASVVMTHDLAAPGLRCRAEQARCAFLGDQADLDGTGDDRPRVVGAPDGTRPHGLEGGVRRVFRLAVVGARQRSVLADRELHEPLGLRVLPPSPVADALAVVEALEDGRRPSGVANEALTVPVLPGSLRTSSGGSVRSGGASGWRLSAYVALAVRARPGGRSRDRPSGRRTNRARWGAPRRPASASAPVPAGPCWRDGSRWRASSLAAGLDGVGAAGCSGGR